MDTILPKVTVIMISYNRPLFVKESIESMYKNPGMEFEFQEDFAVLFLDF